METYVGADHVYTSDETVASYEYNKPGQVKNKKLLPGYDSGPGLETLDYDYNIRGWITGINQGYVANTDQHCDYCAIA